jgi:hypothetical protein
MSKQGMEVTVDGHKYTVICHSGSLGSYWEPPEPDELEIVKRDGVLIDESELSESEITKITDAASAVYCVHAAADAADYADSLREDKNMEAAIKELHRA